MNKYKFRAWDKEQECILYWDDLMNIKYNERWFKDNQGKNYINCIFTDPDLELMQFTCLYDKNGTEIYEGDYVLFDNMLNDEFWSKGEYQEIVFEDGSFWPFRDCFNSDVCVVVGNRYEGVKNDMCS